MEYNNKKKKVARFFQSDFPVIGDGGLLHNIVKVLSTAGLDNPRA